MGNYRRWGITAAAVFLVLCLAGFLFPMIYYLNDDVAMRSILSGAYTGVPDGHTVYMKYPLTGLISLLYRLTGNVPWFSLFMTGMFWLSITFALGHLAGFSKKAGSIGIILTVCTAFLCYALFLPHFVYMHYTVTAAILGGCGLFLTALHDRKKAVLLLVLCYCVRSQVFFLLLPFLAVIVLWKLQEKKQKEQLGLLFLLAGSVLICMVWDGLMYRSEEWQQFRSYNESRTRLYDYHDLLSYEEYKDQYGTVGIGKWEYTVMEQYTLALDDAVDTEMLQAASDIYSVKRQTERSPAAYLRFCLTEYYYHAVHTDKPYNYILICVYFLAAILLIYKREWIHLLLICLMAAGRSAVWLFLIWRGRFPERVYISLYILETMVLAGLICTVIIEKSADTGMKFKPINLPEGSRGKRGPTVIMCTGILLSLILVSVGSLQMKAAAENSDSQWENQKKWNALTAYCEQNEECFYLLDVRSMVSYGGGVWENTLNKTNFLLAGGWMSNTPLLNGRISSLGAEDGGELLAKGMAGDVRILYVTSPERDVSWLSGYLSQRFGDAQVEQVDSIALDSEEIFCVYGIIHQ